MASTDITLIGLDEATLSDDLVTVLADPSTNGGYKASVGDLANYIIANAGLDYTDTATNGTYVKAVSESDGVISVTRETADTTPTEDSTKLITSGGVESALSMDLTSVSGNPITISDASNTNCESLIATLSPIQEGTGDPSPTNVRPISGVNPLTVNRTGKNLLNGNTSVTIDTTDTKTLGSATLPAGTYTFSLKQNNSMTSNTRNTLRVTYGGSNYYESASANNQLSAGTHQMTFELTEEQEVSFWIWGQGLSTATTYSEPQVELGSSATTYEPYQGTAITLNLGSTVYGGSVDLRSGVLTVDRAIIDLGDVTTWAYDSSNIRFTNSAVKNTIELPASNSVAVDAISSAYSVLPYTSWTTNYSLTVTTDGYMTARNTDYTSASDFKTAMSGVKFVYKLANPTTTQLTPQTLRLLQGNNTLWTNGEGLEVEYQPNNFVGKLKAWILDQLS